MILRGVGEHSRGLAVAEKAPVSFVLERVNEPDVRLAVPFGILTVSCVGGLLVRWLTGRLYPGVLSAGIAILVLSLTAIGWAFLAVAASSVI